jgi:predicted ArsR family transcriptional regulator
MTNELLAVEDAVEGLLRANGPRDVIELVAELAVPPAQIEEALAFLVREERVEAVTGEEPGDRVFRAVRRSSRERTA